MSDSLVEEPLGYILLGVFISLWLCGVISLQTFNFFTNYPSERKWLKAFVGILVFADVLQTFMGVGIIWHILIKNFGNSGTAQKSTRTFQIYPVLVALVSGSVQIFFAWRIKVLSTSLFLFVFIVVLAIPQFAGGIAYTFLTVKVGRFADFSNFIGVIIGWVASSVVCDLVITVTLTLILRKHRANRDLGEAAHMIHRVRIMSIHNGLVTILWSFALLAALAASKRGAYYMFFYPLGKVYLITMLASLNSRPIVRPGQDPRAQYQSVLQPNNIPRVPDQGPSSPVRRPLFLDSPLFERGFSLPLCSRRGSMEDVEKTGHQISQVPTHSRAASRAMEYMPVTQEEDESDAPPNHGNDERPSHECTEVQPLVGEQPQTEFPKPPPRSIGSISSRPRGPRLPYAPCSTARSISV